MTLKQDYFQHRNSSIKDNDRNLVAKREVDTIVYLLKVFYGFELNKGCKVASTTSSIKTKSLSGLFGNKLKEPIL